MQWVVACEVGRNEYIGEDVLSILLCEKAERFSGPALL